MATDAMVLSSVSETESELECRRQNVFLLRHVIMNLRVGNYIHKFFFFFFVWIIHCYLNIIVFVLSYGNP